MICFSQKIYLNHRVFQNESKLLSRSEEVSEEFTHTVINEKQAAKYKYKALVSKETKTQLEMEEKVRQSTILHPAVLQATLVTADVLEETSRG